MSIAAERLSTGRFACQSRYTAFRSLHRLLLQITPGQVLKVRLLLRPPHPLTSPSPIATTPDFPIPSRRSSQSRQLEILLKLRLTIRLDRWLLSVYLGECRDNFIAGREVVVCVEGLVCDGRGFDDRRY